LFILQSPPICLASTFDPYISRFWAASPIVNSQIVNLRAQNESYQQAEGAAGFKVDITLEIDYQRANVDQRGFFGQKYVAKQNGRTTTSVLSLTQPLYSNGRISAQVSQAEADVFSAREVFRQSVAAAFKAALQSLADVVRDREILQATRHARDLLSDDLSAIELKLKAGAATISDQAQIAARLAAAKAQVASAEGQLVQDEATFRSLFDLEPGDDIGFDDLPALPQSLDEARAGALEAPALRQAVFDEASARAKLAYVKADRGPDVSLRLSAQSTPLLQYQNGMVDKSLTAGVVLQMPVYTSGIAASKVRQAEAQVAAARFKLEAARRTAIQGAEQAFSAYQTAKASLSNYGDQVSADQTAYESLNEQYRAGLISTIDLLNSEQELASAKIARTSAKRNLMLAEVDLLAACGRLEADVLIPEAPPRLAEREFRPPGFSPIALIVREIDSRAPVSGGKAPVLDQASHPEPRP
jgi:outer membrane protein